MQLIRGQCHFPRRVDASVAAIGNFDGLHRGHQMLLQQAAGLAPELPLVVISFEPLPDEYFYPQRRPERLMEFRDKYLMLKELGVVYWLLLRFNAELANRTAAEFVQSILLDGLGVRHLVVGDDFRFGRGRAGDLDSLRQMAGIHGFSVTTSPTVDADGKRISSTRVRQALVNGEMAMATELLGHPYRISGRIVQGDKRGREIGFPTANIRIKRRRLPLTGVFAVQLWGVNKTCLQGVANLGRRPTVGGDDQLLEVHLFDFDTMLYGRLVAVDLLHRLRDEQKFADLNALQEQIQIDAVQARQFFSVCSKINGNDR